MCKRYTAWDPNACPICALIFKFVSSSSGPVVGLKDPRVSPQEMDIEVHYTYQTGFGEIHAIKACFCQINMRPRESGSVPFPIWAEEGTSVFQSYRSNTYRIPGSPASARITENIPMTSFDVMDIIRQTQNWLQTCISMHFECRSKSGHGQQNPPKEPARIPTRLLQLSGALFDPSVKLIESNGCVENYCALSHWVCAVSSAAYPGLSFDQISVSKPHITDPYQLFKDSSRLL